MTYKSIAFLLALGTGLSTMLLHTKLTDNELKEVANQPKLTIEEIKNITPETVTARKSTEKFAQYITYNFYYKNTLLGVARYMEWDPIYLGYFEVVEDYRKHGLGGILFKKFVETIKTNYPNAKKISLSADPYDIPQELVEKEGEKEAKKIMTEKLIKFYEKHGTTMDGDMGTVYLHPVKDLGNGLELIAN